MNFKLPKFTSYYLVACIVIWALFVFLGLDEQATLRAGFWPSRGISDSNFGGAHLALPAILTPISSAFLHGDYGHLASNMPFLLFAGLMVELRIGTKNTVILAILGAYGSALGYALYPFTGGNVAIGASGVISALIAAAVTININLGKRRIGKYALDTAFRVLLMTLWIIYQLYIGFFTAGGASIAIGGHIGGFIVGLLMGRPLMRSAIGKSRYS